MDLSETFRTLSNRIRLEILKGLRDPARDFPPQDKDDADTMSVCISSIQEGVGLSRPTVSGHLAIL